MSQLNAEHRLFINGVTEEWRRQLVAESGCPLAFTHGPMLDSPIADLFEEYPETKTIAVPTDFPRLVG